MVPDKARLAGVRLLVFDFDGVFTDNSVYVFEDGREAVRCSRGDGMGVARLREHGLEMLILSTEENAVVSARAKKLKLEYFHGVWNKLDQLKRILEEKNVSLDQVAYVGNDINDAECLRSVGVPIVVADAYDEVRQLGAYITKATGGNGAVREICDMFYNARLGGDGGV